MERTNSFRCLDGTALKIIAMVSMVFDHVGDMFFPEVMWPRMIGRIAMPVFAFCVAEGYAHTRDRRKYIARMGAFALISEIPFDLAFFDRPGFEHQNIMVTFFLALIALELFERLRALRAELARKGRVPAYVIFHDATLREMAAKQPTTLEALLSVSGVGQQKAAKYGCQTLDVIRAWKKARDENS